MKISLTRPRPEIVKAENKIAALLSIVPGLAHMYKGHYFVGFFWRSLGMPIVFWAGILLGLATAGVGLFLPLVIWAALAANAYCELDLRRRHRLLPSTDGTELDEVSD